MAPHQIILSAFMLVFIVTQSGAVPASDPANSVISTQDASKPSAKQGLLEIPKNVATLIRNTIDYTLQSYLNLTTPKPNPNRPAGIGDSIIGHYLLGNFYVTPAPAAPYQENNPIPAVTTNFFAEPKPTKIESPPATPAPIKRKPLPVYIEKTPATVTEKVQATVVEKVPATVEEENPTSVEEIVSETKPKPEQPTKAPSPTKIHTLDTDSSISGIFNSNGLLLNSVNEEEVFYIGPTKGSIVFPIVTSTQAAATPELITESITEPAPTSTTEGTGVDEDEDVEEENGTGFEELEFEQLKKSGKRV